MSVFYKGRGEHSVLELETMIEKLKEENIQLLSSELTATRQELERHKSAMKLARELVQFCICDGRAKEISFELNKLLKGDGK